MYHPTIPFKSCFSLFQKESLKYGTCMLALLGCVPLLLEKAAPNKNYVVSNWEKGLYLTCTIKLGIHFGIQYYSVVLH